MTASEWAEKLDSYAPADKGYMLNDAAAMLRKQDAAIKQLREALDYIVRDLEIRAIKGVVAIGDGAYVQGKEALAATEEFK